MTLPYLLLIDLLIDGGGISLLLIDLLIDGGGISLFDLLKMVMCQFAQKKTNVLE